MMLNVRFEQNNSHHNDNSKTREDHKSPESNIFINLNVRASATSKAPLQIDKKKRKVYG